MEQQQARGVRQGMKRAIGFNPHRLAAASAVGLMLAVPIVTMGMLMASKKSEYCITFIEKPLIAMGMLMGVVSIAGLCAAWRGMQWLYWVHMGALFLLVLLLFCFAIFSIEITSGGSGHSVAAEEEGTYPYSPYGFKEYVLSDYPRWMRRKVQRKHEWHEVSLCLQRNDFCGALLPYNGSDPSLFFHSPLSPFQSGCCKPPLACKFLYIDAKHWITPSNPSVNEDCAMWDNDPTLLCYRCTSCKAGVIQATKNRWSKAGVTLFVVVILLVTFYAVMGSIASKNIISSK